MSAEITTSLQALANALAEANNEFASVDAPYCNAPKMQKLAREMERNYGAGKSLQNPDKFRLAVASLSSNGPAEAVKKYGSQLCWGLSRPTPIGVLMEKSDLFPDILKFIEQGFSTNKLRMVAWKGLLDSYLTATEKTRQVGKENWDSLRVFLNQSLPGLFLGRKFTPSWLNCLNDNQNILGEEPCKRYAKSILNEDTEDLDKLRDELAIPEESWFWFNLIMDAVDQAAEEDDKEFINNIPALFKLVVDHKSLLDDCLVKILTRYHQSSTPHKAHPQLQQISIRCWGMPHLHSSARWGKVSTDVQQMIREWIILEDLTDFFLKLEQSGEVDRRRFEYWKRFIKQIDYAYFALGRNTMESCKPDLVELRKKKKGRYSTYNKRDTDAFLLKIGNQLFVEFSTTGNAAYGYEYSSFPIQMNKSYMREDELKQRSVTNFWEAHNSNWEQKFDTELKRLGINPDGHSPTSNYPVPPALKSFLDRQGITTKDNRQKGGALWVWHNQNAGDTANILKKHHFRYKPGKGYYKA